MTRSLICRLAFLLLLALPFVTKGQADLRNTSLTEPGRNLIYIGTINVLALKDIPPHTALNLVAAHGSVSIVHQDSNFLVTGKVPGIDTLSLYQDKKLLLRKAFRVVYFPDPVTRLGVVKDSTASIAELLAYPVIRAEMPGCYYKSRLRISSFDLELFPLRGDRQEYAGSGPALTPEQQNKIRELKSGSRLSISAVMACPDGIPRRLNTIFITIR